MKLASNLFLSLTFAGGLLLISPQQASLTTPSSKNTLPARVQPTAIDEWKIRDRAKQITVRVFSQENTASGILIDKKQVSSEDQQLYLYLVVTNNHVVANQKPDFHVETPDGRVYRASLYPESKIRTIDKIDLKLLYFLSPIAYEKAIFGDSSSIKNEDDVFVAGFACQINSCEELTEFIFKPGTALLLDKSLVNGYQIGFTSETKIGTSGGAVLNKKGELIAINGRGKFPTLDRQYTYADGIQPSSDLRKMMRHFSWGIPINTYKNWASKMSLDNISIPETSNQGVTYLSEGTYNSNTHNSGQSTFSSVVIWVIITIVVFFLLAIMVMVIVIMKKDVLLLKNQKVALKTNREVRDRDLNPTAKKQLTKKSIQLLKIPKEKNKVDGGVLFYIAYGYIFILKENKNCDAPLTEDEDLDPDGGTENKKFFQK